MAGAAVPVIPQGPGMPVMLKRHPRHFITARDLGQIDIDDIERRGFGGSAAADVRRTAQG